MKKTFGEFIKEKRLNAQPKMTLRELSEKLGMNLTMLSDIEHNRKNPFTSEKIELFCKILSLDDEDKAKMYDLAAKGAETVSEDISYTIMNTEAGECARVALRMTREGKITDEQWKNFIRDVEDNN